MLDWLRRRLWPRPTVLSPTTIMQTVRVQKVAQLVQALSFYADPKNYVRENVLMHQSPAARDGGRRARDVLAHLRGEPAEPGRPVLLDHWRNRKR